ncbi:uncharacterized protein LOC131003561 [Salvia miltiorrhiza]|uniref:uncharacterized protein LOC131003561 n=1 Tax=Salvia miltiorrhiza TaxID=226208 RepID=UPI0025AC36F6|nr:uncharacterized protein LOC131003561 [Salvia miltiorrhiza]
MGEWEMGKTDGWIWKETKDGIYTTKSAYSILQSGSSESSAPNDRVKMTATVWDIPAPQKAKVTAWRALRDRLLTCANLRKRNVMIDEVEMNCNACFESVEDLNHTLLRCPKASAIWDGISRWIGFQTARSQAVQDHYFAFSHLGKGKKSK